MKIIILGAGIIGVTTAYFLAKKGHEVTVIEREPSCARECSFSNGGQLSYGHMEPWANPSILPNILKWMGRDDAPLVFRLRADMAMWRWGVQFLLSASHHKSQETTRQMLRLSLHSRDVLHALLQAHPLAFDYQKKGIFHVFHDQKSLDVEAKQAEYQQQFGCDYTLLNREECLIEEPALRYTNQPLIGGILFPQDETGDAHNFTEALAALCQTELGVEFLYNTEITGIETEGDKVTGVHTNKGTLTAEHYVMALGVYSAVYGKKIGLHLPIYPMKGYSISIPVSDEAGAPHASITDQTYKIVYSRLGDIVRIAGTAEFAGYDTTINEARIAPIMQEVKQLFPRLITEENQGNIRKWACLRPSTPSGRPILGKSRYSNLFLNTGHGTLGWTLACGSAQVVADVIEGKQPYIEMSEFG